jgi:hypothetical protein
MLYPKEFILPTTNDPVSLLFYLFIGCTNDNLDTNYVRELAIVTPKEEHLHINSSLPINHVFNCVHDLKKKKVMAIH